MAKEMEQQQQRADGLREKMIAVNRVSIRAVEAGFCEYDEASEMVWVVKWPSTRSLMR